MFNPYECEHIPKKPNNNEKDRLIQQLLEEIQQLLEEIQQLEEENELLKGCIMEICDVVFAEEIPE